MKPVAALANGAWLAASLPAWARFRRALRRPAETQRRILRRLLDINAGCAYGRAHRFGEIRNYEEFRERVPIIEYEDLEPWITRIMRGEQGVLTRDPVTRLVPTSGSTAGRKLIPYTAAFQDELNAAIGPWMVDLCRQCPSVPLGPAYWSISPATPSADDDHSAVPIGFDDDSAYLGGIRRRLAEATFAVPSALRGISDFECSRYLTLLCLLRAPELRLVSVWHPSFFTLLLEALPAWWDELIADVESGRCQRADILPPSLRSAFQTAPQPLRAVKLRRACAADPQTLWPHLRVISCWGDGQATLACAELQRRLPGVNIQTKGLLATEAFVSIPFAAQHPVAVTSHFLEFADAHGATRLAHELRSGESYTVIVTTAGGLWRYRLGDLVEVDGFVAATPSLRFVGRGAAGSDLCGEKLAEVFVTRAIAAACLSCGCSPGFAMLAPEIDASSAWHYTLFIEGDFPSVLPDRLEAELRRNPHYALCRNLGQLGPIHCCKSFGGAYETFCDVNASGGCRRGEVKPQALSPRTDWRFHFASKLERSSDFSTGP